MARRGQRHRTAGGAVSLCVVAAAILTGCSASPTDAPDGVTTGVPTAGVPTAGQATPDAADTSGPYPVTQVVDGDTIKVRRDGRVLKVRLIGMDTPETQDPRKPVQCFGREAAAEAHRLLDGRQFAWKSTRPRIATTGTDGCWPTCGRRATRRCCSTSS